MKDKSFTRLFVPAKSSAQSSDALKKRAGMEINMKRKATAICLTAAVLITMTACNKNDKKDTFHAEQETPVSEDISQETDVPQEENQTENIPSDNTATEEDSTEKYDEITGEAYHTGIKKYENQIFYFAEQGVYSVNLVSNRTKVLYEAPKDRIVQSFCIHKGTVYIVVSDVSGEEPYDQLYHMSAAGSESVLDLDSLEYGSNVSVYEDVLYVTEYGAHKSFAMNEDGTLGKQLSDEQTYCGMLSGVKEWDTSNYLFMYPGDSLNRYQKIWVSDGDDQSIWCFQPEDGTSKEYQLEDQDLMAVKEPYIITRNYLDGENQYHLFNLETMQKTEWISGNEEFLDIDSNGAYFSNRTKIEPARIEYEYITWDGKRTKLFELEGVPGMLNETFAGAIHFSVIDGAVYYLYGEGDKMYLMCRSLNQPDKVSKIGSAYLDKGYAQYGHIERDARTEYFVSDPTRPLIDLSYEYFVFDGTSEADKKMNAFFSEIRDAAVGSALQDAKQVEDYDGVIEDMEPYSYTSQIDRVTRFSDRYFQIDQKDYDYSGGAHGMPFRSYYLMDYETGERLLLNQIVSNTSQEIGAAAAKYFQKMYDANKEKYWENAVEAVKGEAGQNDQFYLTDKGIVFYFAPYDLAAYVYGFIEVEVPYGEFQMKININE